MLTDIGGIDKPQERTGLWAVLVEKLTTIDKHWMGDGHEIKQNMAFRH